MNIYTILKTKPNNEHFLKRYIDFIYYCEKINKNSKNLGYCEEHHICPKAKDLFPEYVSFSEHPWNKIILTARQHFIAHWILYKSYGESQTFAFKSLVNQKSKRQKGRYTKINSRVYEKLKIKTNKLISENNKGKSTYIDKNGNKIWCYTKDPRVLSGELTSISKGRTISHSEKTKNKMSISAKEAKYNPNKLKKLYFLDMRIEVLYHSTIFVLLLEQGWSSNRTKEYRIKQIKDLHCGKKRSKETNKKISNSLKGKSLGRKMSNQDKIKIRISKGSEEYKPNLYYNVKEKYFKNTDILYEENPEHFIKVFVKEKTIWDKDGNKRFCNKNCPIPEGYYSKYPFEEFKIYNTINKKIYIKQFKDINETVDVIIKSPNGKRIKFYCLDTNSNIYLNEEFISQRGVPINCSNSCV